MLVTLRNQRVNQWLIFCVFPLKLMQNSNCMFTIFNYFGAIL